MNGDPKNPDPRGPIPETETVHEVKVTTEEGTFELGVIRINHERTPVAYAQLGDVNVSIARRPDGGVSVQVDDTAEEDVYISVNAIPLLKDPAETNGWPMPWNMDRCENCGEPVRPNGECESCGYEDEAADLPLILAMDDDYCPKSGDGTHQFGEDRSCDLCGEREEA